MFNDYNRPRPMTRQEQIKAEHAAWKWYQIKERNAFIGFNVK